MPDGVSERSEQIDTANAYALPDNIMTAVDLQAKYFSCPGTAGAIFNEDVSVKNSCAICEVFWDAT